MDLPRRLLAGLCACLAFAPGCQAPPSAKRTAESAARARPNVLFITVDTLRSDHCSAYGYSAPTTPHLAALARDGARFDVAYAPMSSTMPSHATMFTSLYPISHRVVQNGIPLSAEPPTLAEILRAQGYQTGAVVSSFAVDSRFGLDRAFDSYDDAFDAEGASSRAKTWNKQEVEGGFDQRASAATAKAARWLDARVKTQPFLLWVHYFDPHAPYDPPEPYRTAFRVREGKSRLDREIAAYDAEIAYTDHELGTLLGKLDVEGLRESTLVVVVGDHGEGLMQHGVMSHGLMIYDEGVRVPLLFRGPGVPAGRTVSSPVELVDVLPTLLDLVGASPQPPLMQGTNLTGMITGAAPPDPERMIYLQRRRYEAKVVHGIAVDGDKFGVRAGKWKYIEAPQEKTRELFDLERDPGELENVVARHPEKAKALAQALESWRLRYAGRGTPAPSVDGDAAERLRALGYVQ